MACFFTKFLVVENPFLRVGNEKEVSNKQEMSKTRSDLSVSIFEQLTLPLRDGHTTTTAADQNNQNQPSNVDVPTTSDPTSEINVSP